MMYREEYYITQKILHDPTSSSKVIDMAKQIIYLLEQLELSERRTCVELLVMTERRKYETAIFSMIIFSLGIIQGIIIFL